MPNVLDLMTKTPEGNFKPKIEKGFVGLFVGESGTGKDNAVASFPKPMYVFDVDHRIAGMQSAIEWLGIDEMKQIDYDQYNVKDKFAKIDSKMELLLNETKKGNSPYKTIYIASISSLGHFLALESMALRGAKKDDNSDYKDAKFISRTIKQMMYAFIMPMQELKINVVVSAHVVNKWGPKNTGGNILDTGIIGEKILGISDNLSEEVPGYFDNVFRFEKEESAAGKISYKVKFKGALAKTIYPMKSNSFDLTNKSFYEQFKKELDTMQFEIKKP